LKNKDITIIQIIYKLIGVTLQAAGYKLHYSKACSLKPYLTSG